MITAAIRVAFRPLLWAWIIFGLVIVFLMAVVGIAVELSMGVMQWVVSFWRNRTADVMEVVEEIAALLRME